ncbi:Uncharacterized protein dnm_042870 [Desulfonema magnum]|uniref:Uncharacterized protein n=1 Tax=Desulfonema magnum TaxID=45655 RepID=A0A975GNX9_9BACT|nr:Uncharacterized protein dnm_042870 [Desulfonema magnum]
MNTFRNHCIFPFIKMPNSPVVNASARGAWLYAFSGRASLSLS